MRRLLVPLVATVTLAACASSSGTVSTTTPPTPATSSTASTTTADTAGAATTTTMSITEAAAAYTQAGPYPVGVTTLQLAKGPKVEVWYPAVAGTTGTETYDVRDYTPPAVKALLTGNAPATYSYAAGRDAAVADGRFPVVLFSHGFAGIRVQSTFLTAHLAGWGMIVVSPEHPSRDLGSVLGGGAKGDATDAVDDLLQSLALITAQNTDATSRFHDHVDSTRVAAVGHSAGGGTVLGAAADPRLLGYVSMASGVLRGRGDGSTTSSISTTDLPAKPSLFLAGSVDSVVPVDAVTRPSFAAAPAPSALWVIDGVGHNGFDDFCTFGNGTGIIGVAEASGLGPLLAAQPALKRLGEDGCVPPAVPVATTFPIVRHVVTAWLRHLFGIDATAVGLGPEMAGAFPVKVTISSK